MKDLHSKPESKNQEISFWKGFGILCLSFVLALLTVLVINI